MVCHVSLELHSDVSCVSRVALCCFMYNKSYTVMCHVSLELYCDVSCVTRVIY